MVTWIEKSEPRERDASMAILGPTSGVADRAKTTTCDLEV